MRQQLYIWIVLMGLWTMTGGVHAQIIDSTYVPKFKVYTYEGKTFMSGRLDTIDIARDKPSKRELRRGQKRLRRYTRLRYNVHKVYPYAQKLSEMIEEVAREMEALETEQAKRDYVKTKEASLFGEYEDDIRKMTRSQGKVLVKLVYRETGTSTFHLIKDHKSGASAMFWQSIGVIFGINLKQEYDPEEEAMIEALVTELERGGYNIAYRKYNYSLDD
ncbi:MAG: DUF4294 domain-containing protein [Bacteroidota bacterium]